MSRQMRRRARRRQRQALQDEQRDLDRAQLRQQRQAFVPSLQLRNLWKAGQADAPYQFMTMTDPIFPPIHFRAEGISTGDFQAGVWFKP